jgi:phosphoenolpyruvate carboxykinase (GTP)
LPRSMSFSLHDFSSAPTANAKLLAWVADIQRLAQPDAVHWVDGSDEENQALCDLLVRNGTFIPLAKRPGSFLARSDPGDVVRPPLWLRVLTEAGAG